MLEDNLKNSDVILDCIFWTPKKNFPKVREYLMNEGRLVLPKQYPKAKTDPKDFEWDLKKYLIYEDPELVKGQLKGIFKVYFNDSHKEGDFILFAYYMREFNNTILQLDPMKRVMKKVYSMLDEVRVTDFYLRPMGLSVFE